MESGTARNAPRSASALLHGELTGEVIGAFYKVHNTLGHGFLESVYVRALAVELEERGVSYIREARINVRYRSRVVGVYRADLFVDNRLIVEVKATQMIGVPDKRQLLHYLRATNTRVGLLLHFGPEAKCHRLVDG